MRNRRSNVIKGKFTGRRRPPRQAQARKQSPWLLFVGVFVTAVAFGGAYTAGWFDRLIYGAPVQLASGATEARASFSFCHTGGGYNCVVDGDTIWLEGANIRIADIDAPETHDYRCQSEKNLGDRATSRLHEVLESGTITLRSIDRDTDTYGRQLRIVMVNGKSVGRTLVSEGLARWYAGGRRPWC